MSSLDNLLNPGEQVLYRSVPSWTLVRWRSVQWAASLGAFLPLPVLGGLFDWLDVSSLTLGMAFMGLLLMSSYRHATKILVTDRRILFRTGPFGPLSVEQMNAAEITQISMTWWRWPTTVCSRGRSGNRLRIPNIIDPGALVAEIARISGRPVPARPRLNYGLAEVWTESISTLSMIILLLSYFHLVHWMMEIIDLYKEVMSFFVIVILVLTQFTIIFISITFGYFMGRQLSTLFFPWLLYRDEARQFLENENDLSRSKYLAALGRIHIRLMEMALSRAYGQPIRRVDAGGMASERRTR